MIPLCQAELIDCKYQLSELTSTAVIRPKESMSNPPSGCAFTTIQGFQCYRVCPSVKATAAAGRTTTRSQLPPPWNAECGGIQQYTIPAVCMLLTCK